MQGKTIDEILNGARDAVNNGVPVSPSSWLDAAQRLNALFQNLDEELIDAESAYMNVKVVYIEEGKTVAEAEARAKATEAYKNYLRLKAKKEQIKEFIRIVKKRVESTWDKNI